MSRLLAILTGLAILALQISLWPEITVRVLPAFAFAAALAWGTSVNLRTGFWLAGVGGLLLDLYAQHDFGMITLASLAGYGAAWGILRGYLSGAVSWGPVLVGAGAGAATYEFVLLLWMKLHVGGSFPFLAEAFGTGTLNALATFVVFLVAAGVASAAAGWFNPRPRHERSLRYR
jgi:cell shape-determining protein MreD